MLEDPLASDWERIPSLDGLAQTLASGLDGLKVLYLGLGSDDVPLFAFSPVGSYGPGALVISGGSGDSVVPLATSVSLLAAGGLPGFETWVICGLDAPRLRQNDSQLGAVNPSLQDHVYARRMPWGPGEDPEQGLPVDLLPLFQADLHPGQEVQCSAESLALARAIRHIKPELVISLRDIPAGGVQMASSQRLDHSDWQELLGALDDLPLQIGPRIILGDTVPDSPGCVVLRSVADEAEAFSPGQAALGPVASWQYLQSEKPDSIYMALYLPRFTDQRLASEEPCAQVRTIQVTQETKLSKGKEEIIRVETLIRPGHPADQAELTITKAKPGDSVGEFADQPARKGWLAAEAALERQAAINAALRAWQESASHMQGEEYQRGMQVLLAAGDTEKNLKAYQTNKRYALPAREADWVYWGQVYRYQTALLLSESLRCLKGESQSDPKVTDLMETLKGLIDQQLSGVDLAAVNAYTLAQISLAWSLKAAEIVRSGGPRRVRLEAAVEKAEKNLADSRRAFRAARQMKLPAAERRQAEEELERAKELLKEAKSALAVKDDSSPEPPDSTEGPKLPPAPEVEKPSERSSVRVDVNDPETWLVGLDRGKVRLDPGLDIERLLPPQIPIPPEWGREPLSWKDQLPKRSPQPMLRRLARTLLETQQPEEPHTASEVVVAERGVQVQSTGFIRRRTELTGKFELSPSSPPPISGSTGNWREFKRSVG